ncbi:hypothetical protein HZA97_05245 [Candidatus Woesearchaeota archaeon]|nr:hypothetical protein [Candidatus Woesearchaeota archaeon]
MKWITLILLGILLLPVVYSQIYSVEYTSTSIQGSTASGSTYEARTSTSYSTGGTAQGSSYQASVGSLGEVSTTSSSGGVSLGEGGGIEKRQLPETPPKVEKPIEVPKPPIINKVSFTISPSTIKVSLKQGETISEQITITNPSSEEIEVTLNKEGLNKFLLISEPYIKIAPEETKTIEILFTASVKEPADVHSGFIQLNSGDIKKSIPVVIEVLAKKALFDIKSSIAGSYQEVGPGQEVPVDFDLSNFGDLKPVDVILTYSLRDMTGKTLWSQQETFAVETTKKVTMNVKIPKNTPEGAYQIYGRIDYKGEYATTAVLINVLNKLQEEKPQKEQPKEVKPKVNEITITREKSRIEIPTSIMIILALVSLFLSVGTIIYAKEETINFSRVNKKIFNFKTLIFALLVLSAGSMMIFGIPATIKNILSVKINLDTVFTWTNILLAVLIILFILIVFQLGRIKKAISHSYSTKPKFNFKIESERENLSILPKTKRMLLFVNENIIIYLLKKIGLLLKSFFSLLLKLLIFLGKFGKAATLTISEDFIWLIKSTKQKLIEKYKSAKAEREYHKQLRKNRLEINVAKPSKVSLPIKPILEPIYVLISFFRELNRRRKVATQYRLASSKNQQLKIKNFKFMKRNYFSEAHDKLVLGITNSIRAAKIRRELATQCRLASSRNQQLRIKNFKLPEIKTPIIDAIKPIIKPQVIDRAIYRLTDKMTESRKDPREDLDRKMKIEKIKALYQGKKEEDN